MTTRGIDTPTDEALARATATIAGASSIALGVPRQSRR